MTNATAIVDRQALADELTALGEERQRELAGPERELAELDSRVGDLQATVREAVAEALDLRLALRQAATRFDSRRSRLEVALRSSASPAIAAFRVTAMTRADQLCSQTGNIEARTARLAAIRAALREVPGLELEPDEGAVEAHLRELGRTVGGDDV